jgi:segregation and condensation protein B
LSQPALETLAIIAYRAPVSRTEISQIRGVQTDGILRTLLNYGLVERIINADDNRTYLYQLTPYCFEQLGIVDESELPPLAPYLPPNFSELGITDEFYDFRNTRSARSD